MGITDTINKINFLNIAKSELKSAAYVVAANQVVSGINKVISSAAKKTKNEKVQTAVESTPGKAALNFAIAAGAKKLPGGVGESDPIKYISSGLRVGSLARIGNKAIEKIFGKGKKAEDKKEAKTEELSKKKEDKVRVEPPVDDSSPNNDWQQFDA